MSYFKINFIDWLATAFLMFATTMCIAQEGKQQSTFNLYRSYADALTRAENKIISVESMTKADAIEFTGYARLLLSVGAAAESSQKQAIDLAKQSGKEDFLLVQNFEHNFVGNQRAPGSFFGGAHWVFNLKPIRFVEATPVNVLTEIKAHLRDIASYNSSTIKKFEFIKAEYKNSKNLLTKEHLIHLLELAKNPIYSELVPEYKVLIRSVNYPDAPFALTALALLVQQHDGKNSIDDFRRWAQYHEYPKLRATALSALITLGERAQAELILKTEKNTWVRATIERELL